MAQRARAVAKGPIKYSKHDPHGQQAMVDMSLPQCALQVAVGESEDHAKFLKSMDEYYKQVRQLLEAKPTDSQEDNFRRYQTTKEVQSKLSNMPKEQKAHTLRDEVCAPGPDPHQAPRRIWPHPGFLVLQCVCIRCLPRQVQHRLVEQDFYRCIVHGSPQRNLRPCDYYARFHGLGKLQGSDLRVRTRDVPQSEVHTRWEHRIFQIDGDGDSWRSARTSAVLCRHDDIRPYLLRVPVRTFCLQADLLGVRWCEVWEVGDAPRGPFVRFIHCHRDVLGRSSPLPLHGRYACGSGACHSALRLGVGGTDLGRLVRRLQVARSIVCAQEQLSVVHEVAQTMLREDRGEGHPRSRHYCFPLRAPCEPPCAPRQSTMGLAHGTFRRCGVRLGPWG
mmetsp:Transcript_49755/g.133643  ORF Transcript_49755/g.133643 Transcript_49755/m.133643 type:complete len:390 (+) Transcript_49755:45-1214(+)